MIRGRLKLYKNSEGEKLYPVCSWEDNQHKLYNAHDRVMIAISEEGYTEKLADELERIEDAMAAFDRYVINGLVYATYKEGQVIKDIVWAYNARH